MINASVKLAQQRLQALGFNVGKAGVDGQIGNDTRAAVRAYQKHVGLPATGLLTDATMQALAKSPAAPPTPRQRPEPDKLGTGNTDTNPRLRPQQGAQSVLPARIQEGQPSGPRTPMAPLGGQRPDMSARPDQAGGGLSRPQGLEGAQLADARANLNPDVNFAPGTTFDSIFRREQTGNARTREAQAITGPLNYEQRTGPPQVGTMIDQPFAQRWDNTTAPPPDNTTAMPPPAVTAQPQFTPTPGNPGYGLPGMPPRASFGQAAGDVAQELFGAKPAYGGPDVPMSGPQPPDNPNLQNSLNEAAAKEALRMQLYQMLFGARIQPQPNQPAYSDQYATPSQPPAFAPPMGAYR